MNPKDVPKHYDFDGNVDESIRIALDYIRNKMTPEELDAYDKRMEHTGQGPIRESVDLLEAHLKGNE